MIKTLSNKNAICIIGAILITCCREESDTKFVGSHSSRQRSIRDTIANTQAHYSGDQASQDEAISRRMAISEDAKVSSPKWVQSLESATKKYSGDDLSTYLYAYADTHASSPDFDRVGFIENLKKLKGPGSQFLSILTLIYSGRIDISATRMTSEIESIELSSFEKKLLSSSIVTGPVLNQASLDELSNLYNNAEEGSLLTTPLSVLLQERIYEAIGDKTPKNILKFLEDHKQLVNLDISNLVDTSSQIDPKPWLQAFNDYCQNNNSNYKDLFEKYAPRIVDGLISQAPPAELLLQVNQSDDQKFKNQVTENIASRWVTSDAGEVAKWATNAPRGEQRDSVVYHLSVELDAIGLKSEAQQWAATIDNLKLLKKLRERGLINIK